MRANPGKLSSRWEFVAAQRAETGVAAIGSPPQQEEGWPRHQEKAAEPHLMERTGWCGQEIPGPQPPSARTNEASRLFLPPSSCRGEFVKADLCGHQSPGTRTPPWFALKPHWIGYPTIRFRILPLTKIRFRTCLPSRNRLRAASFSAASTTVSSMASALTTTVPRVFPLI